MTTRRTRALHLLAAAALVAACQPATTELDSPTPPVVQTPEASPAAPSATPIAMAPSCADAFDSGDGRITFVIRAGSSNTISTVNADGSDFRVVVEPTDPREQPHVAVEAPRWVPGNRILFGSNRDGGQDDWTLYLVPATGGEPTPAMSLLMEGIEYYGSISPDEALLAYGKAILTGNPAEPFRNAGIFVGYLGEQREYQLTIAPAGGIDEWPDFSPDGSLVAFNRFGAEGEGGLYIVGLDGSDLHRIIGPDMQPIRPRWSPDGDLIAFSSNADQFEEDSADVWVVRPDGTGLRKVVDASGGDQAYFPDWAPDGEHVVYLRHVAGSGTQDLAVAAIDGSMRCLLRAANASEVLRDPDWEAFPPAAAEHADLVEASTAPRQTPPACTYGDVSTIQAPEAGWATILLDTEIGLDQGFLPGDLVDTASAGLNAGHLVRDLVVDDLRAMADAARVAGAPLAVQSAFRSYQTQEATFAYWTRVAGVEAALKTSARPGHSEHQLGTTLDFKSDGGGAPWASDWAQTDAGAWMQANAWRFGFVMSYPRGAIAETCYEYEPWHYRYVGRWAASRIHDAEVTLRSWLWSRLQNRHRPLPAIAQRESLGYG